MAKKRITAADVAREGRAEGPVVTDVNTGAAAEAAAVAMTAAAGAAGAKPRRKPLRVGDTAADAAVSGGGADAAVAAEAAGVAGAAENDSTDHAHSAVVGEVVDKQGEKLDEIAVSGAKGAVKATKKNGGGKQKGAPKTGGRKKGTPNIVTADTRQAIRQAWQDYVSTGRFRDDLEELSGYDRLVLMERLVGYTVPKLKSIDLDAKVEQRVTIEDRLRQLAMEEE